MAATEQAILRGAITFPVTEVRSWTARNWLARRDDRVDYLLGAICLLICAIMVAPLVVSISASLKTTQEAAAIPPTYFTHQLSLDKWKRLHNRCRAAEQF